MDCGGQNCTEPVSPYSGRILVLVSLLLQCATEREIEVFRFDGAEKVFCRVRGEPVRDFNLIFNKTLEARMEMSNADRDEIVTGGVCAVFVVAGAVTIESPRRAVLIARETVLIELDRNETVFLRLTSDHAAYLLIRVRGD